jgi:hypothetical protein
MVVTILPTDKGFNTEGCGTWTSDLSAITSSTTSFPAGTYIVNTDITPGTYGAPGGGTCYWARLSNFTGTNDILANDTPSGNTVVTIAPTDEGFQSSGCGTFTAASPPAAGVAANPATAAGAASPPAAGVAGSPATAAGVASPSAAAPTPSTTFSSCGGGVEARVGTTSCDFAQNVFYEFFKNSPLRQFPVYSPATGMKYQMQCVGESLVTCSGGTNAEVRFPMSAVLAYTQADASAYANSHNVGPSG